MSSVTSQTVPHRTGVGLILQIRFQGEYAYGTLGNPAARSMKEAVASAFSDSGAVAVIFDLLDLEYRWGNAICEIALPLFRPDRSFFPACIVAAGETAKALAPLTGPNWMWGIAGIPLVNTVDQALSNLMIRAA